MNLYRYNVTLRQAGCQEVTTAIVAKDAAQAREKGNYRWSRGMQFVTWRLCDIKVRKLEQVTGPELMI
jgi:hypothetical protein